MIRNLIILIIVGAVCSVVPAVASSPVSLSFQARDTIPFNRDTIPVTLNTIQFIRDTIPLALDTIHIDQDTLLEQENVFKTFKKYWNTLGNKEARDSLLKKLSREDPDFPDDDFNSTMEALAPHSGKVVRNIYYKQVDVFGPRNILDTSFTTDMKLIHFANNLHTNTQEWVLRQALFFSRHDTVNAFEFAENERYLRSTPLIQDARLYLLNENDSPDSVDVLVLTRDIFSYGGEFRSISFSGFTVDLYNHNLFGTWQALELGTGWHQEQDPPWGYEFEYRNHNLGGSFINVAAGHSVLNRRPPLDTGTYEGSWYLSVERPLYRSTAQWIGGLTLAKNYSINKRRLPDSLYRDYEYTEMDVWAGYNFRNQFRDHHNGTLSDRPNLAVLLRYNNIAFQKTPAQPVFREAPILNDRRFVLSQFALFRQDFFRTRYFFGFGRTEDIPVGYNISLTTGLEKWVGRNRVYSGLEAQKFWITRDNILINSRVGISSFWREGLQSEDAVFHLQLDYYSYLFRLFKSERPYRQLISLNYVGTPNPHFYEPLNINRENGIEGYRHTKVNGYQRLNLRSETTYYSRQNLLGFKFNFFASLEASQLGDEHSFILKNRVYTGFGAGCRIRNENLPLRTLKISANYFPNAPGEVSSFQLRLTTQVDLRFTNSLLRKPEFLPFF